MSCKSAHVNGSSRGVFQICTDGEVDEVVHAVAIHSELVHAVLPREIGVVPSFGFQHRPSTEAFQHFLDRSQALLFDFVC